MRSRRPLKAALLAATFSTACASWIPATALFEREASCASGYSQCPQAGLPDDFCCPTGHTCIPLAANTTVVCCPAGSDCSLINPITCDLSQEDPETHASALIKTTALNGRLGHCGDGTCCPFGYSCNQDNQCAKDTNQNASPIQSTPTSTSAASAASSTASGTVTGSSSTASTSGAGATVVPAPAETTTGSPAPAPTASGGNSASGDNSGSGDKSGPSAGVIAGSVVGGIAAAILLGVLACVLARRRRRRQGKDRDDTDPLKLSRSTSSFGNIVSNPLTARGGPVISKPIVSGNSTMRSDFGRKTASPQGSPDSRRDSAFGARFGRPSSADMSVSPPSTPPSRGGAAAGAANGPPRIPPIRTMRQSSVAYGHPTYAETPRPHEATRVEREPSSLSINIFADPRTVHGDRDAGAASRQSNLTTFTEMMERADLGGIRRGEPYVPPSAAGSPAAARRR